MSEHEHVFGTWNTARPSFCAVCDMPKGGWPALDATPPASETVADIIARPPEEQDVVAVIEGVESPPLSVTREADASARGPSLGRTPEDRADEPRSPVESQGNVGIARHSFDECDCVPGHRCDCWEYRDEVAALKQAIEHIEIATVLTPMSETVDAAWKALIIELDEPQPGMTSWGSIQRHRPAIEAAIRAAALDEARAAAADELQRSGDPDRMLAAIDALREDADAS